MHEHMAATAATHSVSHNAGMFTLFARTLSASMHIFVVETTQTGRTSTFGTPSLGNFIALRRCLEDREVPACVRGAGRIVHLMRQPRKRSSKQVRTYAGTYRSDTRTNGSNQQPHSVSHTSGMYTREQLLS